jgi:ketosteroid isomerase-like protein
MGLTAGVDPRFESPRGGIAIRAVVSENRLRTNVRGSTFSLVRESMGDRETRSVTSAIRGRSRAFEAAFAAGDAEGLVDGYFVSDSEGPVASPPGTKPVRGRAAIVDMFKRQFVDAAAIRLETLSVDVSGSIAYEFGRAHLDLRSGVELKGRYAVLWRKGVRGWRVKTDFFAEGWPD